MSQKGGKSDRSRETARATALGWILLKNSISDPGCRFRPSDHDSCSRDFNYLEMAVSLQIRPNGLRDARRLSFSTVSGGQPTFASDFPRKLSGCSAKPDTAPLLHLSEPLRIPVSPRYKLSGITAVVARNAKALTSKRLITPLSWLSSSFGVR
jgi:hypothetical protein